MIEPGYWRVNGVWYDLMLGANGIFKALVVSQGRNTEEMVVAGKSGHL